MEPGDIRKDVSAAYAKALQLARKGKGGGCCGGGSCCGGGAQQGSNAALAGYGEAGDAHREAAAASFACGNPLVFAGVQPGETVLDLGCGAGLDLLIAAEKVGPKGRVMGVDMTEEMLAAARENIRRAGLANVEVRRGLIEDLPVADASVDWVISNCVINLSPEKHRVFAEIYRVLRPGGRFSISDIVAEGLPEWMRGDIAAHAACIAGAIPEAEYLRGLLEAGLADVSAGERMVYGRDEIMSMFGGALSGVFPGPEAACDGAAALAGKVASVRFRGVRPL